MWRTRKDLLRGCASLLVVAVSLGVCFTVVLFSWPDKEQTRVARSSNKVPVAFGSSTIHGAELIPAAFQTGSIQNR
jgi:hypothetical protein